MELNAIADLRSASHFWSTLSLESDVARRSNRSLEFDLQDVLYMDAGIAADILIAIEWLTRTGISVTVTLPGGKSESHDDGPNTEASTTFAQVNRFLRGSGFLQALHEVSSFKPATRSSIKVIYPDTDLFTPNRRYPSVETIPFQWAKGAHRSERTKQSLGDSLDRILGSSIGYSKLDATIARLVREIVLHELVENVRHHGSSTGDVPALIFATKVNWSDSSQFSLDPGASPSEHGWDSAPSHLGHKCLRIIVADAGTGIPESLATKLGGIDERPIDINCDGWSSEGKVLLHSLRFASSRDRQSRFGVRGLARVDRLTKTMRGVVVVRSGSALVTKSHVHRYAKASEIAVKSSIGTRLDIHLLPDVSANSDPSLSTEGEQAKTQAEFVRSIDDATSFEGLERVGEQVSVAVLENFGADAFGYRRLEDLIASFIDECSRLGRLPVIYFPAWSHNELETNLRALDDFRDSYLDEADGAASFAHCDIALCYSAAFQRVWFGGSRAAREVLWSLEEGEKEFQPITGETRDELVGRWIWPTGTRGYALRPAISEGAQATKDLLSGVLLSELDREDAKSDHNVVTPSGSVASSWHNIDYLVEQVGPEHLGAALAVQVFDSDEVMEKLTSASEVSVSTAGSVPDGLVVGFLNAMGERIRCRRSYRRFTELPTQGEVTIVVSGAVHSEDTVRGVAANSLRAGVGVACVCVVHDGRDDHPDLDVFGNQIPYFSVTQRPLTAQLNSETRPVEGGERQLAVLKDPNLGALGDIDFEHPPFHFGHLVGATGRHFTCHNRVDVFQRAPSVHGNLFDRITDRATKFLSEAGERREVPVVLETEVSVAYVGDSLARSQSIAQDLNEFLSEQGFDSKIYRAERSTSRVGELALRHESLSDLPADIPIIFVDIGANTGGTIIELVSWAIRERKRAVQIQVGLSRLDIPSRERLAVMNELLTKADSFIQIRFATAGTPYLRDESCALCKVRAERQQLAATNIPAALRQHLEETIEQYRPLHASELNDNAGLRSPFSNDLDSTLTREWVELRWMFESARVSGQGLADLVRLLSDPADKHAAALVHMLTVEPSILSRRPGVLRSIRRRLASSLAGQLDKALQSGDSLYAVECLIALRATSKSAFLEKCLQLNLEHFAALSVRLSAHPGFEIVVGCLSLIEKSYNRSPRYLEAIERICDRFTKIDNADIRASFASLESSVSAVRSSLPLTVAGAWRQWSRYYVGESNTGHLEAQNFALEPWRRLSTSVMQIESGGSSPPDDGLHEMAMSWRRGVVPFLSRKILSPGAALQSALQSTEVADIFEDEGCSELLRLILLFQTEPARVGREIAMVADLVDRAATGEPQAIVAAHNQLEWWRQAIFRSDGSGPTFARVVNRILEASPAAMVEVCRTSADEHGYAFAPPDSMSPPQATSVVTLSLDEETHDIAIPIPSEVLGAVIRELLRNGLSRRATRVSVHAVYSADTLEIEFASFGSDPDVHHGNRGEERVRASVERFGGALKSNPVQEGWRAVLVLPALLRSSIAFGRGPAEAVPGSE